MKNFHEVKAIAKINRIFFIYAIKSSKEMHLAVSKQQIDASSNI